MPSDLVTLAQGDLELSVASLGAELQSLKSHGTELLWHGDPTYWSGRSPLLFPIVGPTPEGTIEIGEFSAPMAKHGFARRSLFELVTHNAGSCTHSLTASEETLSQFPFEFRLLVTHRIDGATLTVVADVQNCDQKAMPFCFGFHPAFLWPLPGCAGRPHQIVLDNGAEPALARIDTKANRLLDERFASPFSEGRLTLETHQFDADAMMFPNGAGQGLTYGVEHGPQLQFQFENLPNLALWTKTGGAPYICVEPWHGMAAPQGASAQMSDRLFALELPPGETERFSWSVTPKLSGVQE